MRASRGGRHICSAPFADLTAVGFLHQGLQLATMTPPLNAIVNVRGGPYFQGHEPTDPLGVALFGGFSPGTAAVRDGDTRRVLLSDTDPSLPRGAAKGGRRRHRGGSSTLPSTFTRSSRYAGDHKPHMEEVAAWVQASSAATRYEAAWPPECR